MPKADLTAASVLLLEDDLILQRRIASKLRSLGAEVVAADNLKKARRQITDQQFELALMDIHLPDGQSMELLKEKAFSPNTIVVIMTAHGGVKEAVSALQLGAADYLTKPFELTELLVVFERAMAARQNFRLEQHRQSDKEKWNFLFGDALQGLKETLDRILEADLRRQGRLPPVLIQGETGTGKTSIARWLHHHGPLAAKEIVEVNCSALPESLAEAELFGHERGAFTDAKSARIGLFEAASGGTLFLDEIPSLSPALQAKVLTALEDQHIRRVGGTRMIQIHTRVIAAANLNLLQLVSEGNFREDLYHRLDLYRICIPPLRERGKDILKLAEHFLAKLCQQHRIQRKQITEAGRRRLLEYPWPGNVRELAHEMERGIVFEPGDKLSFERLLSSSNRPFSSTWSSHDWLNEAALFDGFTLEAATDRFIELALRRSQGNVSAAARLLGVPRDFIRYRLQRDKKRPEGQEGGS